VAVKVTLVPKELAFRKDEEVTVVVVVAAVTVWGSVEDVDVTKFVGLVEGVKTAVRL
jgi:hypothetical protein